MGLSSFSSVSDVSLFLSFSISLTFFLFLFFSADYANEKLQHLFNEHIFYLEEEEYRKEGIDFNSGEFPNNQVCLDLIEKAPLGILFQLEEECLMGHGNDSNLARKLHRVHGPKSAKPHPHYALCGPSTLWRGNVNDFVVKHYAGDIMYTTTHFVEKNRDTLYSGLAEVFTASKDDFVRSLFLSDSSGAPLSADKKHKLHQTVSKRFRDQLKDLIQSMRRTTPRFVRCMKSNDFKEARFFESANVLRQLKYAGVMEALRVRRAGYPNRLYFIDFLSRFPVILGQQKWRNISADASAGNVSPEEWKSECMKLLGHKAFRQRLDAKGYQMGRTKVFLRQGVLHLMDTIHNEFLAVSASKIQAAARRCLCRHRYNMTRKFAGFTQRIVRGFIARKKHEKLVKELARHRAELKRLEDERRRKVQTSKMAQKSLAQLEEAAEMLGDARSLRDVQGDLIELTSKKMGALVKRAQNLISNAAVLAEKLSEVKSGGSLKALEKVVNRFSKATSSAVDAARAASDQIRAEKVRRKDVYEKEVKRRQAEERKRIQRERVVSKRELKAMRAEEKYTRWVYAQRLKHERLREKRELAAMRAEEKYTRKLAAERSRIEIANRQREREQMKKEEAQQRWVVKESRRLERARREEERQRRRKRELEEQRAMALEELNQRRIAREMERVKKEELAKIEKARKQREFEELQAMRREEAYQKTLVHNMWLRWMERRIKWHRMEQRRQEWERSAMALEEVSMKAWEAKRSDLERDYMIAQRERMLMQAEDVLSRCLNLSMSLANRVAHIKEIEFEESEKKAHEKASAFDLIREAGNSCVSAVKSVADRCVAKERMERRVMQLRVAKGESMDRKRWDLRRREENAAFALEDQRSSLMKLRRFEQRRNDGLSGIDLVARAAAVQHGAFSPQSKSSKVFEHEVPHQPSWNTMQRDALRRRMIEYSPKRGQGRDTHLEEYASYSPPASPKDDIEDGAREVLEVDMSLSPQGRPFEPEGDLASEQPLSGPVECEGGSGASQRSPHHSRIMSRISNEALRKVRRYGGSRDTAATGFDTLRSQDETAKRVERIKALHRRAIAFSKDAHAAPSARDDIDSPSLMSEQRRPPVVRRRSSRMAPPPPAAVPSDSYANGFSLPLPPPPSPEQLGRRNRRGSGEYVKVANRHARNRPRKHHRTPSQEIEHNFVYQQDVDHNERHRARQGQEQAATFRRPDRAQQPVARRQHELTEPSYRPRLGSMLRSAPPLASDMARSLLGYPDENRSRPAAKQKRKNRSHPLKTRVRDHSRRLREDRAHRLPPPPRGVRSASIIEHSALYESDSSDDREDGIFLRPSEEAEAQRWFATDYEENDTTLPAPPPGVRSAGRVRADYEAFKDMQTKKMQARRGEFVLPQKRAENYRAGGSDGEFQPQSAPLASSQQRKRGYSKLAPPPRGIRSASIMEMQRDAVSEQLVAYHARGGLYGGGVKLLEGLIPSSVLSRFENEERFREVLESDENIRSLVEQEFPATFSDALVKSGLYESHEDSTGVAQDPEVLRIRRNCMRLERGQAYSDYPTQDVEFTFAPNEEQYGVLMRERQLAQRIVTERSAEEQNFISPVATKRVPRVVTRAEQLAKDVAFYYGNNAS